MRSRMKFPIASVMLKTNVVGSWTYSSASLIQPRTVSWMFES